MDAAFSLTGPIDYSLLNISLLPCSLSVVVRLNRDAMKLFVQLINELVYRPLDNK